MQRKLQAWLAKDPAHRRAFLSMERSWQLLPVVAERGQASLLRRNVSKGLPDDRNFLTSAWRSRRYAFGLAALVIVLVGLGVRSALTERAPWAQYHTNLGKVLNIPLADGSTVVLNTDTEIRVRLGDKRRNVELLRGEALFQISHDPGRPFEVEVDGIRVKAIGTAFSVRLRDGEHFDVLMREGVVTLVRASWQEFIPDILQPREQKLSKGDVASVSRGIATILTHSSEEVTRRLAWIKGRLNFDGETLRNAVREMNRFNRWRLQIDDPSIADLRIGGDFNPTDPSVFVAALTRVFDVQATYSTDEESGTGVIHLVHK
jgi:transmembrane sensor